MRITLPRHHNLINTCVATVIERHREELPDLSTVFILVANALQTAYIRRHLLQAAKAIGISALIPPHITTLKALFRTRYKNTYLPEQSSKLLLGTELEKMIHLFHNENCWRLADKMLPLFNELEEGEEIRSSKLPLWQESELIDQIYNAWKDANATADKLNEAACYRRALRDNTLIDKDHSLFLCGIDKLTPTETQWAEKLATENRLVWIEYATEPSFETPRAKVLSLIWNNPQQQPIAQRAAACKKDLPTSPLQQHLSIFKAETFEQHAYGLQLRIVDWLHQGITSIAVVTQDRKLARRLRALLDRKNIPVHDHAGWAMSTTSSATALLHLIPSTHIEFTPDTLTHLVRSPRCQYPFDNTSVNTANKEIHTLLSNSPDVIETLSEAVQYICAKPCRPDTRKLSKHIHHALQALHKLRATKQSIPFSRFFATLKNTMDKLGMSKTFNLDPAGQQILNVLAQMKVTADIENIHGNWSLWRSWLIYMLDIQNFLPETPDKGIEFYNPNQAALLNTDAVILAGLDRKHTHSSAQQYMLNDTSRKHLGITTQSQQLELLNTRFQTLVEKTNRVLISYQSTEDNCSINPAPWLDELQNFHCIAYNNDLTDNDLPTRAQDAIKTGTQAISAPAPSITHCPQPPAPERLWPQSFSAQTYQSIINCPYQFFVQYCLRVKPHREMTDYENRANFGSKLHLCLAVFHQTVHAKNPTGPVWNEENTAYMNQIAHTIVDQVFSTGTERHYIAAWYKREAKTAMENYIDWIVKQKIGDAEFVMEQEASKQLAEDFLLKGRLDCVARKPDGNITVIDYKTGKLPSTKKQKKAQTYNFPFIASCTKTPARPITYNLTEHPEKASYSITMKATI